jgi:hypothetical protein
VKIDQIFLISSGAVNLGIGLLIVDGRLGDALVGAGIVLFNIGLSIKEEK